jgi:hypothetical protein
MVNKKINKKDGLVCRVSPGEKKMKRLYIVRILGGFVREGQDGIEGKEAGREDCDRGQASGA